MRSTAKGYRATEAGSETQAQASTQSSLALIPETQEDPVESLVPVGDISTEYDADMSASLDKPEEPSVSEERPAEGPIGTESSPAGSITATDLSSQAENVPSNRFVADVFGPASIAPEPVYKKRGRKRGSRCKSV